MDYVITGLSPEPFIHLYGQPEDYLAQHHARRVVADASPGFPDRVEMRDAEPGESLLLLNHVSVDADSPYRASHAIFVREGARQPYRGENAVPEVMLTRLLSLRAFDAEGMMTDAVLAKGSDIEPAILRLLSGPQTRVVHAHNAVRGCYSGCIERLR